MTRLPGALFIVDTRREHIAVKEAQKLNIPIFAGITGPTYFDEDGDAQKQLYLLRIKGRKFVELEQ